MRKNEKTWENMRKNEKKWENMRKNEKKWDFEKFWEILKKKKINKET